MCDMWREAIIWTNAGLLLLIGPLRNFNQNTTIFIQENEFENASRKIPAIFITSGMVRQSVCPFCLFGEKF